MNYTTFFIILLIATPICAYTVVFQKATLYWGRKLSNFKIFSMKPNMQDAITPKYQNSLNTLFITSYSFSFIGGWILFKWYIGVIAFIVMTLTITIFKAFLPWYDSDYFYKKIIKNLHLRREHYKIKGDDLRVYACQMTIDKLKDENRNI